MVDWLTEGHSDHDVEQALRELYPGVDAREAEGKLLERLEDLGRPSRDALRGWCLAAYRRLYRKAVEIGDISTAAKIVKEINANTK